MVTIAVMEFLWAELDIEIIGNSIDNKFDEFG